MITNSLSLDGGSSILEIIYIFISVGEFEIEISNSQWRSIAREIDNLNSLTIDGDVSLRDLEIEFRISVIWGSIIFYDSRRN